MRRARTTPAVSRGPGAARGRAARFAAVVLAGLGLGAGTAAPARAATFDELVAQARPVGTLTAPAALELAEALAEHVTEYITRSNWAALYVPVGEDDSRYFFEEPRHDVEALSAALPYLPDALQAQVKAYLAQLLGAKQIWSAASRAPRTGGARREHYLDTNGAPILYARIATEPFLPTAALYALWLYGERSGDLALVTTQWNAGAKSAAAAGTTGDLRVMSENLAGLLGAARIAKRLGDTASEAAIGARGQALLDAMAAKFNTDLDRQLTATREFWAQESNLGRNFAIQRTVIEPMPVFTPETGAELAARAAARVARLADVIDRWYPSWWQAWGERAQGDENFTNYPDLCFSLYTMQAYAKLAPTASLALWADVPWSRADAYYVKRVVAAIEAISTRGAPPIVDRLDGGVAATDAGVTPRDAAPGGGVGPAGGAGGGGGAAGGDAPGDGGIAGGAGGSGGASDGGAASGCGCRVGGATPPGFAAGLVLLALAGAAISRRRRARAAARDRAAAR